MIPPLIENFENFKYPTELSYSYGRHAMTPYALWSCSVSGETCCRSCSCEACSKLPNLLFFDATVYVPDLQSKLDLLICTTSWFLWNHRNDTLWYLFVSGHFGSESSKLCGSLLGNEWRSFCFLRLYKVFLFLILGYI